MPMSQCSKQSVRFRISDFEFRILNLDFEPARKRILAMNRQTFVENTKVIYGSEPKNYTGATGNSDYVSLKNYDRAACVIQTGAWAGGTAAVTLTQATDVSGSGAKALSFAAQWTYQSTNFTVDALTRTAVSSDTFNLSTANTVH